MIKKIFLILTVVIFVGGALFVDFTLNRSGDNNSKFITVSPAYSNVDDGRCKPSKDPYHDCCSVKDGQVGCFNVEAFDECVFDSDCGSD